MNNEEPLKEAIDFTKPDFVFTPKENHNWRQKGPFLVCKSCEILHAVYIGQDRLMVGIDKDGKPLFKNRSEISR